jgi:hypothetical protein
MCLFEVPDVKPTKPQAVPKHKQTQTPDGLLLLMQCVILARREEPKKPAVLRR